MPAFKSGAGIQTQDFPGAQQAPHNLSYIPGPSSFKFGWLTTWKYNKAYLEENSILLPSHVFKTKTNFKKWPIWRCSQESLCEKLTLWEQEPNLSFRGSEVVAPVKGVP